MAELRDHTDIPPSVKRMIVNGVNLTYLEQGQGAPVVFLHGLATDHRIWESHYEAVARRHRCIALTQRYFGTDPWPDGGANFSMKTHADDLAAFIHELHAGPVNLVGWSYGGAVALAVAVQHPELVASLFTYELALATFVTDPADAQTAADDRKEMTGPAAMAAKAGDHTEAVRLLMDGVSAQTGAFDALPPSVRSVMRDNARMLPLQFTAPPPLPITGLQLAQLKVPIAFARGEQTRVFYKISTDTASRCISGSRLIVIPKARHLWPFQDPAAFSDTLLGFLKDTDRLRVANE